MREKRRLFLGITLTSIISAISMEGGIYMKVSYLSEIAERISNIHFFLAMAVMITILIALRICGYVR